MEERSGPHDLGGVHSFFGPVDVEARTITAYWQSQIDALAQLLFQKKILKSDEFRRFIEALPGQSYYDFSYYGKWASAVLQILLRQARLSEEEVHRAFFGEEDSQLRFKVGDRVWVKPFDRKGYEILLCNLVNDGQGYFVNHT